MCPLLAQIGRADHQQAAALFRPVLADYERGLDGLAQTDFVGQQHTFLKRVAQCEQCRLDLVRVQVDTGIEQRLGKAVDPIGAMAPREFVGVVLGVVGGDQPVWS